MNREIKFRAWDGVIVMHKVVAIIFNLARTKVFGLQVNIDGCLVDINRPEIERGWVLMQYTGLKDKNGTEIYESDVVRWKHGEQGKNEFYEKIARVSFHQGAFQIESTSLSEWRRNESGSLKERLSHFQQTMFRKDFYYYRDFDLEVIGNIYQNPELLEQT